MALRDLVLDPQIMALRYAGAALAEIRLLMQEQIDGAWEPQKIRQVAEFVRGRAISAKLTVDDAIKDALARTPVVDGEGV